MSVHVHTCPLGIRGQATCLVTRLKRCGTAHAEAHNNASGAIVKYRNALLTRRRDRMASRRFSRLIACSSAIAVSAVVFLAPASGATNGMCTFIKCRADCPAEGIEEYCEEKCEMPAEELTYMSCGIAPNDGCEEPEPWKIICSNAEIIE